TIDRPSTLPADSIDVSRQLRPVALEAQGMLCNRPAPVIDDDEAVRTFSDEGEDVALASTISQSDTARLLNMETRITKVREGLAKRLCLLCEKLDLDVGNSAVPRDPMPKVGPT